MSAAPLSTEAARRTHQRLSRPILLNLTHTTLLSLCLNPDRMAWPVRVANLSWPPNGSKRSLGPLDFSDLLGLTRPCEECLRYGRGLVHGKRRQNGRPVGSCRREWCS